MTSASTDRRAEDALAFVMRSTRQRPQTRAELESKLADRGFDAEVRRAVLKQAASIGAVDDEAFARAWIADRGEGRGYALPRLRVELARRGVPDAVAEAALEPLVGRDVVGTATDLARARIARLPSDLDPQAACRRLVGYLVRRGYEQRLATRVAIEVAGLDRTWD